MFQLFLENSVRTIQYVLLWIVYVILQTFALYFIVALPWWVLILGGVTDATIYGVLGILLWRVLKYGNYSVLSVYQQMINYFALALLTIVVWLGAGYGLFYLIFGNTDTALLNPVLPLKGFIGLLIYLLIIQWFRLMGNQTETSAENFPPIEIQDENLSKKAVQKDLLERIAVKSGTKIHVVLVPEILYLQADGDYVQMYTREGKYLKEQTMKYFEEHLPENQFVRVHRSVIVNVEMISRIELYEKQNQLLTLKNGQQIKTSPAGYKALRMALNL